MSEVDSPDLVQVRPKILVLVPRYPYPVIGGDRLRIYGICKELSKECDLTLLSLCDNASEMNAPLPDDQVFRSIHRVFLSKWRSYLNTFFAIFTGIPLQVAYYKSMSFNRKLNSLLPSHDAVFSHLLRTGDYVKDVDKPSIVEMTDAISMNYNRSRALKKISGFRSIVYGVEAKRLNRYEKSSVNYHDALCFISYIDAKYLYGEPIPDNVLVCGMGLHTESIEFQFNSNSSQVVAFIGNMVSIQNQDAALWFANEVLPLLRAVGDFRFRVVGQIPDNVRGKFIRHTGVEITGKVPSVADSVRDCFAGVCSVRVGAGVQTKLLEYMALGLPAVTTSIGLEGLEARDEEDLYVADTPTDIAQKLMLLWNDKETAGKMASNARKYVESHHSRSAMLSPLINRVKELANVSKICSKAPKSPQF